MKKYLLFVAYTKKYAEDAINFLICENIFDYIVIVENRSLELKLKSFRGVIISGSNSNNEFSAWQEALNHLNEHELFDMNDEVIFANDTVFVHRRFSRLRWSLFLRGSCVQSVVGFRSTFGHRFQLNGLSSDEWISTYLFKTRFACLKSINYKIDYYDDLVGAISTSIENKIILLEDKILERHIEEWLFNGGWYNSSPLSKSNYEFMKKKILCILNEKYLSCKFKEKNLRLVDVLPEYSIYWLGDALLRRFKIGII